jgi:hypothetical protein
MSFNRIESKAMFLGDKGFIVSTEGGYESRGSFTRDEKYDKILMDWLQEHYKNNQGEHVADMRCYAYIDCAYILTESGEIYLLAIDGIGDIGLCKSGEITRIDMLNKEKVVEASFIVKGIQFRTSAGNVYGCGKNEYGNLGIGNKEEKFDKLVRMQMPDNQNIIKLSSGHSNLVITEESKIYGCGCGCGYNYSGEFSIGDYENRFIPTLLKSFGDEKITEISSDSHNIFLTEKGNVFTSGSNYHGQLGHENIKYTNIPTKIQSLTNVISICARQFESYFVTKNKIYVCGLIEREKIDIPTEMEFFRGKGIVKICQITYNIYFISKHGDIYVSGRPIGNEPEDITGIRLLKGIKCLPERLPKIKNPEILLGKKERFKYFVEVEEPVELGWFFNDNQPDSKKPEIDSPSQKKSELNI